MKDIGFDFSKKKNRLFKIKWIDKLNKIKSFPTIIIANEFFDALPIHVFQMTTDGWREQLIDVVEATTEEEDDVTRNSDAGSSNNMKNGSSSHNSAANKESSRRHDRNFFC